MNTFLFDEIIFGPLNSRRLGLSLGVNLLPVDSKLCNFNCVYCECGWTDLKNAPKVKFHSRSEVFENMEKKLVELKFANTNPQHITFAGNGEPTMHPDFEKIMDDTILLRNRYFPECKITVLSNALMLHKKSVYDALNKSDNRILKLDAGTEEMFRRINKPIASRSLSWVTDRLLSFKGNFTLQTMFLKGVYNGLSVDNTTDKEVESWLRLVKQLNPNLVMLYSLDRAAPAKDMEQVPKERLNEIASEVNRLGIKTQVS